MDVKNSRFLSQCDSEKSDSLMVLVKMDDLTWLLVAFVVMFFLAFLRCGWILWQNTDASCHIRRFIYGRCYHCLAIEEREAESLRTRLIERERRNYFTSDLMPTYTPSDQEVIGQI